MTANGVAAWTDQDGDGVATATLNSAGGGSVSGESDVPGLVADLALKAPLASPVLTGTPSLPTGTTGVTQSAADSSTKLATTAFVTTADNLKANLAGPTFTGVVTLPTGTVATTQSATDGSTKLATTAYVDTADALKANLAGPTFTGTVTLPTSTVTSTMILDGTILNADVNASAAIAATKVVQPLPPDVHAANVSLYSRATAAYGGKAVAITALKPFFHPIWLPGVSAITISNVRFRVSALFAGSTVGVAIYSATYASSAHVSASLVAQLNAAQSGAATGTFEPALTTGAAGSGASALAMDFTTTRYLIGFMASDVGTLACGGFGLSGADTGMGVISWTGTARSGTTDWPSSFTEAANIAAMSSAPGIPAIDLITATGAFYL